MYIKKLSSGDEIAWDNYVLHHRDATFFHKCGWKRVIEDTMGHSASYLMAIENDQVVGVYPLIILSTGLFGMMGVSLPFVNYGGILANSMEAEKLLIAEADKIGRDAGCSYIELRQRSPLQTELPDSEHKISSVISLNGGSEKVFSRLHRNVRNKIRKSRKNGVQVQKGIEYMDDFYNIYARNLRDLGTPVMTRNFFERVAETFPGETVVYRASRLGKSIGAKVTLMDNKVCYFEWSASLRESLQYAPVHAMNWTAIESACENGCQFIDFGRSTAESSHQNFKKYWGVDTQKMKWAYQLLNCAEIPGLQKENPRFSFAISMWKKLPVFLSKLLGPPLARRLP